jgi:hypothetical protein
LVIELNTGWGCPATGTRSILITEDTLMKNNLDAVLTAIANSYKDQILDNSRFYIEVNIGKQADRLGYTDVKAAYFDAYAIVPLKEPVPGMKVRIDGRTFVNYAQLESGVAVPGYVAKFSNLPYRNFQPNHSMILNEA